MPKGFPNNGINKGQFQKGNKTGFQKGHFDFVPFETRKKAGIKISGRLKI